MNEAKWEEIGRILPQVILAYMTGNSIMVVQLIDQMAAAARGLNAEVR